jgi:peptidoglycan hydrolase-like protein with peptidoglycan-binding domain
MKRFVFLALTGLILTPAAAFAAHDSASLSSSNVLSVQQALNAKGYNVGRADGHWGPRSSAALRNFQQENNLSTTGNIDASTAERLGVNLSMNNNASVTGTTSRILGRTNHGLSTSTDVDSRASARSEAGGSINNSAEAQAKTDAHVGHGNGLGLGADVGVGVGASGSVNQ